MRTLYFVFASLLFSNQLLSQEYQLKPLGKKIVNDSMFLQVYEVKIFNNTGHPICLKISNTFRAKILSEDTVQLASLKINNSNIFYNLSISQQNVDNGYNDLIDYPLILNTRTCFVATVSMLRNINWKDSSWIEYSYIAEPDLDYQQLLDNYIKKTHWDKDTLRSFTKKMALN